MVTLHYLNLNAKSNVPKANPAPTIGPIKGEINIAPIITAVELTFRPIDAIIIAHAKIQRLAPVKETFPLTYSKTILFFSSPICRLNKFLNIVIPMEDLRKHEHCLLLYDGQ